MWNLVVKIVFLIVAWYLGYEVGVKVEKARQPAKALETLRDSIPHPFRPAPTPTAPRDGIFPLFPGDDSGVVVTPTVLLPDQPLTEEEFRRLQEQLRQPTPAPPLEPQPSPPMPDVTPQRNPTARVQQPSSCSTCRGFFRRPFFLRRF